MKKIILVFILSFLFSSLFAKEQVVLTNGEWPPYLSQKLPQQGFASQVVREAFKAVDLEVKYVFLPWRRALFNAKQGLHNNKKYHGTLVWVYTENRTKDFLYSDEVITEHEFLYFLKKSPVNWKKIEDLKGKVIGGTMHTVYPILQEAQKNGILKIDRAGNYNKLFQRLLAKRIDAVVQVENVARYFQKTHLTKEQRQKIAYSKTVLERRHYYVIFSKNLKENEKLLKQFNKGLKIIKSNGVYDKLWQKMQNGYYDKSLK